MPNSLAPNTCLALVLCICWTASSSDLVNQALLRNRLHKPSDTHGHSQHRFLNSSSASDVFSASGTNVIKAVVSSAKQVDRGPQNSQSLPGSAGLNENRGSDLFSGDSLKEEPPARIHIPTRLEAWRSAVPEGGRSAKCHPLCNAHGTCNEDLGRCDCLNTRSGADCSVIKTPACEVQPGYITPCHSLLGSVPTCECAAQCDFQGTIIEELPSCLARVDALSPERRDKALTATIHAIDGVDRVEVEYLSKGRGVSTPVESTLGDVRELLLKKRQLLPFDRCPGNCSLAGICERMLDREEARCKCHEDRQGASCEFAVTNFCVNQCSGRGRCSQGECHCNEGWWGVDCSEGGPPTTAAVKKNTSPPRIYVYDMPHEWTTGIIRHTRADSAYCIHRIYDRDGRAHGAGNAYQTQVWLHERLLRSEHRTFDGAQADFYFIPFWHLCQKRRFQPSDLLLLHLNYVQMTWPYWNATRGRRHMILMPDDNGACDLTPEVLELLGNVIFVQHNGDQTTNTVTPLSNALKHRPRWGFRSGCHVPGRDIVIPPAVGSRYGGRWSEVQASFNKVVQQDPVAQRKTTLFFIGTRVQVGSPGYSGGVRDLVFHHHAEEPTFNLVDLKQRLTAGNAQQSVHYLTSKFCLAPSGAGWGIRTVIAMFYGCIPVVVQDNVSMPYEEYLPWPQFSIRLSAAQIPQMATILNSVSAAELRKLQQGLACVWSRFQWTSIFGNWRPLGADGNVVGPDAFDTFIEVLQERVRHERSGADIMLKSVCGAQGASENHTSFCEFPCAPGITSST